MRLTLGNKRTAIAFALLTHRRSDMQQRQLPQQRQRRWRLDLAPAGAAGRRSRRWAPPGCGWRRRTRRPAATTACCPSSSAWAGSCACTRPATVTTWSPPPPPLFPLDPARPPPSLATPSSRPLPLCTHMRSSKGSATHIRVRCPVVLHGARCGVPWAPSSLSGGHTRAGFAGDAGDESVRQAREAGHLHQQRQGALARPSIPPLPLVLDGCRFCSLRRAPSARRQGGALCRTDCLTTGSSCPLYVCAVMRRAVNTCRQEKNRCHLHNATAPAPDLWSHHGAAMWACTQWWMWM